MRQPHLNAESTEEERIPVRMPEGCRKYCPKTGQELYGLLKKNLYGSPLAPKNWAKCRDQFMRELNQRDGWTVKQMNYAPCMWSIDIDNGGTTERTYVLIHTDDIDGITIEEKTKCEGGRSSFLEA